MPSSERAQRLRSRGEAELAALTPQSKLCRQCGQEKPGEVFARDRNKPDGRDTRCKPCAALAVSEYRRKNPEATRASKRRSYLRTYQSTTRPYRLKSRYGLTAREYQELYEAQNGFCAICLQPDRGRSANGSPHTGLAVDHSHDDGRVRALLCSNCNKALGCLGDDADRAQAAADYLRRHKENEHG